MAQNNAPFAAGIVPRLRIVFLTIALVLVSVSLVGFSQVRDLKASINQLTNSSIAIFVKTEETERNLKNLLLHLQQMETIHSLRELHPLQVSVNNELTALRGNTVDLRQSGYSKDAAEKISKSLNELRLWTLKILATKEAILAHELHSDDISREISTFRSETRNILEDLAHATMSLDSTFDGIDMKTKDGFEEIERRHHLSLALANTVTELTLELEAAIENAERIASTRDDATLEGLEAALRQKTRSISQYIAKLPTSQEQLELAILVSRLRELVFDKNGLASETRKLLGLHAELQVYRTKQLVPITKISGLAVSLTQTARGRIEASRQGLLLASNQLVGVLIATGITLIGIIFASSVFIVEAQINQRMSKLTKGVLAIAKGETDHAVDVSGPDELGAMAKALETFKLNASELRRSNAELEKFAYVAAHDLRSPLRAIQDLVEWVLEDSDNKLSKESQAYLKLLENRVRRLSRLLTDLLEYAMVGKEQESLDSVSIEDIVEETIELIDPTRKFVFSFSGTSEEVVTYVTPLRQILLNLINNAIKHHDHTRGHINIDARLGSGRIICSVSDDGPGIDPAYHERIFGLFQTLRPRDEMEGSGLGLAIIQKLLEHYDGSILVRSNPKFGRGTEFTFDMPDGAQGVSELKHAA